MKEDATNKYEAYSKRLNQAESTSEEKVRSLINENERLKEENETARKSNQQQ